VRAWHAIRQPTVRLRLTALYAVIFAVCGVVLVLVTFLLTANASILLPGVDGLFFSGSPTGFTQGATVIVNGPVSAQQLQAAVQTRQAETLAQLAISAGIALAVTLAVAVMLTWMAAGRVLSPIRAITATARRLSQENLRERIALDGPRDELRDLAETIDAMLDRLGTAFEAQRRFVANASHELRTPLARERALIDVGLSNAEASADSLRNMAERVRAAVDEQERLIEGLLTLARGERGIERHEFVDLADIAIRALDGVQGLPGHADGLAIARGLRPATVVGDTEMLERVVVNLLDNAMAHNVDGGRVELATGTQNGNAFLHVANTGPVIPPNVVPALFEPFRRRGSDRAGKHRGHGLGLSIVAAVVKAHGGRVDAQPRDGGGLDIYVRLPAAEPIQRPPRGGEALG
jgi:signal transduction histidine kinase